MHKNNNKYSKNIYKTVYDFIVLHSPSFFLFLKHVLPTSETAAWHCATARLHDWLCAYVQTSILRINELLCVRTLGLDWKRLIKSPLVYFLFIFIWKLCGAPKQVTPHTSIFILRILLKTVLKKNRPFIDFNVRTKTSGSWSTGP